jgi:hypothetical protein
MFPVVRIPMFPVVRIPMFPVVRIPMFPAEALVESPIVRTAVSIVALTYFIFVLLLKGCLIRYSVRQSRSAPFSRVICIVN